MPAADISLVTATDNCTLNPTITLLSEVSDGNTCPEVITRTYQAEDECGNVSTCTQTITIDDTTPPEITCPSGVTVECAGDVPAADISLVTATDNCTANPIITLLSDVSDGNTCPEVITRTYQAEDECGNVSTCTQTITIDDTIPPEITCPGAINVECIGDIPPVDISQVTATDNCTLNPTITLLSEIADGSSCPQVITRTYQAEDECGNVSTCTQTITVDDTTPPEITCPSGITVECAGDVPVADISLVTATDNCTASPIITLLSEVSDGNTCPEVITRTYQAEDECGNVSTCTQTITIDDTTPPVITCPGGVTVE